MGNGPNRVSSNVFRGAVPLQLAHASSAASRVKPHTGSAGIAPLSVSVGSTNNTGINPWWTYEEGAIPGVGKYMVNVANGNLIVQSDDVDVPERGIDLAFRRTYNSMSGRDQNADDGSPTPGQYGDGWTNTLDTHLAVNSSGGVSVFDIDGARYDYTLSETGCLTPPAGMHNTLCWDGGCGYFWTKKSGTVYYYFEPSFGPGCEAWATQSPAYSGRLYMIFARNNNNWIRLTYSWAGGDATNSANLTQISVAHEDGQALTLNFAVAASGATLLSSVVRPDTVAITYAYDASNDLTAVTEPSSGSSNGAVNNTMHAYGWYAGHQISGAAGPRWTTGSWGGDGGYVSFAYSNGQVVNVWHAGIMNFAPPDGTNTQLQSGPPTGGYTLAADTFVYNSGSTTFGDWDGHGSIWYFDSASRVTQTQEWTGALWLLTYTAWDASNNLTESIDARGNATDYAYDPNGNTVAVALPAVSTNQGTFRPTSLYSYDRTNNANNIVQYCDPVETHSLGADWTSNPGTSDSLCPNQSGATRYTWDYSDGAELFGRLNNSYTPLGYHESYSYSVISQGGDFGLPTMVTGDGFSQLDNTFVTPQKSMTYDGYGNVATYNSGNGSSSLSYDSLNRLTAATDPDNVMARTCYYANGSVQATQSAAQYALDGGLCGTHSIIYTYDADGNESTETHHYSSGNDVTHKWYDGEDRLVEVQAPGSDSTKWARYKYDLSQGGTVSVDGSSPFRAYGNLFATAVNGGSWPTSRGQAFDALDRGTVVYRYKPTGGIYQTTSTYDAGASTYGLLATTADGLGETTVYSYDVAVRTTNVSFQGDGGVTPARTYVFDADGRPTLITSSNGAKSYVYDSASRLTSTAQTNTGFTGSTISYDYYPNGWRSDLSVSGPYVSQTQLAKYSYRADGERDAQVFSYAGNSWQFSWGLTAAGRESSFADPYYARQKTYDAYGRLATDTLEQGAYTAFTYNAEDGVTGYAAFRGQTAGISYDANNQLTGEGFAPGGDLWPNGGPGSGGGACMTTTMVCDERNGAAVSQLDSGDDWTRSKNWNYDNAGRQNVETGTYDWSGPCNDPLHPEDTTCYQDIGAAKSNAFDAENHLIGATSGLSPALDSCPREGQSTSPNQSQPTPPPPPSVTPSIFYGPDGHVAKINGEQIYWDGDQPLFTVNGSGALDDIKVDGFAVYSAQQTQIAILDRDFSETQVSQHNSTGYDQWGPNSSYHLSCAASPTVAGSSGYTTITEIVSQPGTDGIYAFGNTFQGARAYDPIAQQWTAPDAYAGDAHDPMSQKSYMWNRNNPVQYGDPNGFLSTGQQEHLAAYLQKFYKASPSNEACTDFITDAYKTGISVNLRNEVAMNVSSAVAFGGAAGYSYHGLFNNFDFAGNVSNLHHFFETTNQIVAKGTQYQVGDILFMRGGNGVMDHVAMIAAMGANGTPSFVAEATGKETVVKPWADLVKAMKQQHLKIDSVGRDSLDTKPK
jgi:YD repeat-containing protein